MEADFFAKKLNPMQLEAVKSVHGPLLILAGAGSGKTRALTYRMIYLISEGEASPSEILAVTFTNKAAREMEQRCWKALDEFGIPLSEPPWISTFHSTCTKILREHIHLLDYQPFFNIYDASDSLQLIKKILATLNINDKAYPAKGFKAKIDEAKSSALLPDDLPQKNDSLMDDKQIEVYKYYEEELKKANSIDFSGLLLKTYELFRNYPAILEMYQDRFRFIMVDEYQDTNHVQYLIVKMLAQKYKNICVVGDEDQSIYSWRGADIRNILDFEKDFDNCKMIKLEQNYRSSKNIVEAATHLIKNNSQRKEKELFTNNNEGSKILIKEVNTDYDEARFVLSKIRHLTEVDTHNYNEIAVFYRTNAQSRVLEDQLRSNGIPYKLIGSLKFYERKEIKDILSYMKLAINVSDDISLKRIINVPARGIGKTTVTKLEMLADTNGFRLFEAIRVACTQKLVHSGAVKKLFNFYAMIGQFQNDVKELKPSEVFQNILEKTEYAIRLKAENSVEATNRIKNIEEFYNAILQFEEERGDDATMVNFLEEMALVSDADNIDEDEKSVTLMTLHLSKGLEYPNVFIVGMENGLFPGFRSIEGDFEAMEEERRLAYVGLTRAEKNLFLSYARTRRVWGQEQNHMPSTFLSEIPEQYVVHERSSDPNRPRAILGKPSWKKTKFKAEETFDSFPDYENQSNDFYAEGSGSSYQRGMRVKHPTFGPGTIYKVEGSGDTEKVTVKFPNNRLKKFVTKYARLEVL